ncbi:MAG: hypothetical protein IK077_00780 [Thermoguttaceae bacterium]|nr:hypothetical protein [Thermoguttaceae bacterium]
MKKLNIIIATIGLSLMGATLRAESNSEESQIVTFEMNDDSDAPKGLKYTLELYPKEILLGDVVYLATYVENVSDETFKDFPDLGERQIGKHFIKRINISSKSLSEEGAWSLILKDYAWIPESETEEYDYWNLPKRDLPAGEKRLCELAAIEFPPLEDWEKVLWLCLKENVTSDGVVCQLQITCQFPYNANDEYDDVSSSSSQVRILRHSQWGIYRFQDKTATQNIVVKPRPEKETNVLDKWYNYTPEELFPRDTKTGNKGFDDIHRRKVDDEYFIEINGLKYDPCRFTRTGFRKPSIPNNPTTLEGWRNLDDKMCDSTMRDEVRLTRLLLEYYSADETKTEQTKRELIDWLTSLPDPQRVVFLAFIVNEGVVYFCQTPFADKSLDLLRGVFDLLPEPLKTRVCDFEKKVPSPEELADGSKETPDGFRVWTYKGQIGKEKIWAKFVQRYRDEKDVCLEFRDGSSEALYSSQLSDEDKNYIREKQKNAQQ